MADVAYNVDVAVLASLLAEQHREILLLRHRLQQMQAAYAELQQQVGQPAGMGEPIAMVTRKKEEAAE
jgi:hypothetical protein